MTLDEWLSQFKDELKKLRRHLTEEHVQTIAFAYYGDEHPRVAAREYHARVQSAVLPAAPTRTSKRSKK